MLLFNSTSLTLFTAFSSAHLQSQFLLSAHTLGYVGRREANAEIEKKIELAHAQICHRVGKNKKKQKQIFMVKMQTMELNQGNSNIVCFHQ